MNLDIQHYLKFLAEVRRAQVNSTASIDRSRHRRHHVQLGMGDHRRRRAAVGSVSFSRLTTPP